MIHNGDRLFSKWGPRPTATELPRSTWKLQVPEHDSVWCFRLSGLAAPESDMVNMLSHWLLTQDLPVQFTLPPQGGQGKWEHTKLSPLSLPVSYKNLKLGQGKGETLGFRAWLWSPRTGVWAKSQKLSRLSFLSGNTGIMISAITNLALRAIADIVVLF